MRSNASKCGCVRRTLAHIHYHKHTHAHTHARTHTRVQRERVWMSNSCQEICMYDTWTTYDNVSEALLLSTPTLSHSLSLYLSHTHTLSLSFKLSHTSCQTLSPSCYTHTRTHTHTYTIVSWSDSLNDKECVSNMDSEEKNFLGKDLALVRSFSFDSKIFEKWIRAFILFSCRAIYF